MGRRGPSFRRSALIVAVLASTLGGPAAGGDPARRLRPFAGPALVPRATPACAGGLVYDDGSFENAYNVVGVAAADLVMRFDLPAVPVALDQVCLCFTRTGGDDRVSFDLLVYAADGPGSEPGTLLTGLTGVEAAAIPFFPAAAFYEVPLAAFGITLAAPRVFLGPSWDTLADGEVFVCGDDNGPGGQPMFFSTDQGASWTNLLAIAPQVAALGVRADLGPADGPEVCVPDATTLCLADDRFRVRLDWRRRNGATGSGMVVPFGSDDSGLLYFFNPDNWEMLIKILDGCPVNGHFWVFFAATTNVEFALTVTDTATGAENRYSNPLGQAALPVQDTQAFATCP